jgi:hypothetical protein
MHVATDIGRENEIALTQLRKVVWTSEAKTIPIQAVSERSARISGENLWPVADGKNTAEAEPLVSNSLTRWLAALCDGVDCLEVTASKWTSSIRDVQRTVTPLRLVETNTDLRDATCSLVGIGRVLNKLVKNSSLILLCDLAR